METSQTSIFCIATIVLGICHIQKLKNTKLQQIFDKNSWFFPIASRLYEYL